MADTNRQWEIDGEMHNERDAQQMVQSYRSAYTLNRARNLVTQALKSGHLEECNVIFADALENLDW